MNDLTALYSVLIDYVNIRPHCPRSRLTTLTHTNCADHLAHKIFDINYATVAS